MGKGLALLGLILIIVGLFPIWVEFIPVAGLGAYASYFDLGVYTLPLGSYFFTEVMLGLIGFGVILLLVGIMK